MAGSVRMAAFLAATLTFAVAGCGDDGPTEPSDGGGTAVTTTTDPAWSPPGTPVLDGLEVPEGAALLGRPVTVPHTYEYDGEPVRDPDGVRAFLRITGDPFAVFDDLAAQAREAGFDLPGSAGSCLWAVEPDLESADPRIRPVAGPDPEEEISGARCEARAGDGETTLEVVLDHDAARPALVELRTSSLDLDGAPPRHGAAEQSRANRRARLGDTPAAREDEPASFLPADDPVPDGAADRLPAAAREEPDTAPGDPLLPTVWCRSDQDAGDLLVPEGARVLARPVSGAVYPDEGNLAVVLVDDAAAAVDDLHRQAEGATGATGGGGFFSGEGDEVELQDGTVVPSRSWGVSAGGDVCSAIASPDGSTVLISVGRG